MARRKLAIDALIAAAIACSVLAITAIAHSGEEAYPTKWERDKSVAFRFDNSVPGDYKKRVVAAAKQWNKVHASLSFKKAKGKAHTYPQTECGSKYQDNLITVRSLNGALGYTSWCLFDGSSEIYSFQMAIDKDINWYTGSGSPPADKYDLFTTVMHEFGHAEGRSEHYRDGVSECTDPPGEVMCATLANGVKRHLLKHDKHTFDQAY
jgi:hypothetical protein